MHKCGECGERCVYVKHKVIKIWAGNGPTACGGGGTCWLGSRDSPIGVMYS